MYLSFDLWLCFQGSDWYGRKGSVRSNPDPFWNKDLNPKIQSKILHKFAKNMSECLFRMPQRNEEKLSCSQVQPGQVTTAVAYFPSISGLASWPDTRIWICLHWNKRTIFPCSLLRCVDLWVRNCVILASWHSGHGRLFTLFISHKFTHLSR